MPLRRTALAALARLVVLAAAASASAPLQSRPVDVYALDLAWRDDRDRPFTLASLDGTPAVLTLAYGACRRVCSTSLRLMEQLQQLADRRGVALQFVVVGLDPEADRPADWAELRRERHLERANWHFLSGDAASVRRLAQRLGVRYWRQGEHLMHDFRLVQLSAEGRLARSLDHFGEPVDRLLP